MLSLFYNVFPNPPNGMFYTQTVCISVRIKSVITHCTSNHHHAWFDGFVSLKLMKSKRVENVEIRSIFVGKIYEFFESPIQ